MKLDKARVLPIVKAALKEDIGTGDITTSALVDRHASADAVIIAQEDCVVSGLPVAEWTLSQVDYSVRFKPNCRDGDAVGAGMELAYLEGHTAAILRAERVMLNFLTFMSGVATATKAFADKVRPFGVKIMDTRKTLPLLRYLEKYAVTCGGGTSHRMGLYDQALIKDNHLNHRRASAGGRTVTAGEIVASCRQRVMKGSCVEVEVENRRDFASALEAKPDIIMLDNMSPAEVRACAALRAKAKSKVLLEVSGGITLETVEAYAATGIDMISVGALTSSVRTVPMSLELVLS